MSKLDVMAEENKEEALSVYNCVDTEEKESWFEMFLPTAPSEASMKGIRRAFCSDCEEPYRHLMLSQGKCIKGKIRV